MESVLLKFLNEIRENWNGEGYIKFAQRFSIIIYIYKKKRIEEEFLKQIIPPDLIRAEGRKSVER